MADYNKGDFTQQGIDGDVTALVRLNQKRIARLKLSSDDETSGVNVSGYVFDELNGEKYPIGGSQPTGTLNITENGTYDVSTYANANVEVEGGSFPMCTINVTPGSLLTTLPSDSVFGLNENYQVNHDYTLPITILCPYDYSAFELNYYVYTLDSREILTSLYSDTFFTNLVNCSVETSVDGEFTYFGIKITDPTLPSSLTMNADVLDQRYE